MFYNTSAWVKYSCLMFYNTTWEVEAYRRGGGGWVVVVVAGGVQQQAACVSTESKTYWGAEYILSYDLQHKSSSSIVSPHVLQYICVVEIFITVGRSRTVKSDRDRREEVGGVGGGWGRRGPRSEDPGQWNRTEIEEKRCTACKGELRVQ